jgi:hypothetical protein
MIEVPFINPLRYKKQGFSSNYNTKFFDELLFPDTIEDYEQEVTYYQPWLITDPLSQEIESDEASVAIRFVRISDGVTVLSSTYTQVSSTIVDSVTIYTYRHTADLTSVGEGFFYVLAVAGTTTIESNKIFISSSQPGTILWKYRNTKSPYEGIPWELDATFYFYLRVQGYIKPKLPERIATTYTNQRVNTAMLKSVPYTSWYYVTDASGAPWYMADIMNRALGCNVLYGDGRLFTVPDTAKWEEKEEENYPMSGWGIDMLESEVKTSRSFDSAGGPGTVTPAAKKELFSDWWTVTAGATSVTGLSAIWGYSIADIEEVVEVDREGTEYNIVTGTPVNRQAKHNTSANQIEFDTSLPFNAGETVFLLFKRK